MSDKYVLVLLQSYILRLTINRPDYYELGILESDFMNTQVFTHFIYVLNIIITNQKMYKKYMLKLLNSKTN